MWSTLTALTWSGATYSIMPYLTGDTLDGAAEICRVLRIPDVPYFRQAVYGALLELGAAYNWELFGDGTVDEYAEAAQLMLGEFLTNGECETVIYPHSWSVWHDESIPLGAAAFTKVIDNAQAYNHLVRFTTAVNGNAFENKFYLAAGDYWLWVLCMKSFDAGKMDFYIDNTVVWSAVDFYDAGTIRNFETKSALITITDGWHTLKGVVNGKNASSSTYHNRMTKLWFQRDED